MAREGEAEFYVDVLIVVNEVPISENITSSILTEKLSLKLGISLIYS